MLLLKWVFCFFPSGGIQEPKISPNKSTVFFLSYFISIPFSLVFIENHTSFPFTFAIVAHPWNLIYGGVLVVEI